jgi:hypothetical protein
MKPISNPFALVLLGAVPFTFGWLGHGPASQQADLLRLTPEQVQILSHMRLVTVDDPQMGKLSTLVIEGLNVQIVNGLGATNGNRLDPYSVDPDDVQTNGLGNLILGYNEPGYSTPARTGSHGLVLGTAGSYSSFGGIVSGSSNAVSAPHACAVGGSQSKARGTGAVALGGGVNDASGVGAVAVGGGFNAASGPQAAAVGGARSLASGTFSSVTGGYKSFASGETASVHGGALNRAAGDFSTVSGGRERLARGPNDWVAGSLVEDE